MRDELKGKRPSDSSLIPHPSSLHLMTATLTFVLIIIFIALIFDFSNGFHDAANSIATVVSTRVLSPGVAVVWAAFFNFIAFVIYGTRVAKAIGDGININLIAPDYRLYVLLSALVGAIAWNLITWYLGLPTSSSHALLGGYAGAGMAAYGGVSGLLKVDVWEKVILFIVLSPLIGLLLGFFLMVAVFWIFRKWSPHRVDRCFRKGQLLSAAAIRGQVGRRGPHRLGLDTHDPLRRPHLRALLPDLQTLGPRLTLKPRLHELSRVRLLPRSNAARVYARAGARIPYKMILDRQE